MKILHNEPIAAGSQGIRAGLCPPLSGFFPSIVYITLVDIPNIFKELRGFYRIFTQYTHAQSCLERVIGLIKLTLVSFKLYISREFANCWVWQPVFPSSRIDQALSLSMLSASVPKFELISIYIFLPFRNL